MLHGKRTFTNWWSMHCLCGDCKVVLVWLKTLVWMKWHLEPSHPSLPFTTSTTLSTIMKQYRMKWALFSPPWWLKGSSGGRGDLHLHFNIGQLNYMKLHVTWSLNWSLTLVGLSTFTVGFHNNIEAYNDFWGETNDVILVLLTLLESRVALIALHGWHSHQRCGDFGWDKDGGPRVSDCYKMTCRGTISIGVALSFMNGYRYYCSPLDMPIIVEKCYGRITCRVWVCRWSISDNALYASAIHQPTAMWHLPLNHWAFSQD